MNKEHDILEQAAKAFSEGPIPSGPPEDLIRQTLDKIEKEQTTIPLLERILKMKSLPKIAVAAIIIVALSAVLLFPTGPGSFALADVYEIVQQAPAFVYKMSMTMNGTMTGSTPPQNMEMEGTITVSKEYGMIMENTMHMIDQNTTMTQNIYILSAEKKMIQIMPNEKKYITMAFTEDLLQKMKEQNNDPREMIKKILKSEYTDLGISEIDGVKVQGFQTTDPAYAGVMCDDINATIWVDVKTGLPYRSEFSMKIGETLEMQGEMYDYEWNTIVQADDFVPVIPEDYTSMGNVELPKMDETSAIDGLRFHAELVGSYPEKIDMANLMQAMSKIRESETEAAIEFKKQMELAKTEEDTVQAMMQQMAPLQSLSMFYANLVQEKKDVAYFGSQVTPDDSDAVLMRWKVEGTTYKVIFGDLTIAEMEYEKLKDIEPQPKTEPSQP